MTPAVIARAPQRRVEFYILFHRVSIGYFGLLLAASQSPEAQRADMFDSFYRSVTRSIQSRVHTVGNLLLPSGVLSPRGVLLYIQLQHPVGTRVVVLTARLHPSPIGHVERLTGTEGGY